MKNDHLVCLFFVSVCWLFYCFFKVNRLKLNYISSQISVNIIKEFDLIIIIKAIAVVGFCLKYNQSRNFQVNHYCLKI